MNIRTKRKETFTTIQNRIVNDKRLSADALGVLLWCLSKPEDWEYRVSVISERFTIGVEKTTRIMSELRKHGYASLINIRDETGRIKGRQYVIFDDPEETETGENRNREKPCHGSTVSGKTAKTTNPELVPKTEKTENTERAIAISENDERGKLIRQIGATHLSLFENLSIDATEDKIAEVLPFLEYRHEIGKPYSFHTMKQLIKFVRSLTVDEIRDAVTFSLRNGYQGLIQQSSSKNKTQDAKPRFTDMYNTRRGTTKH